MLLKMSPGKLLEAQRGGLDPLKHWGGAKSKKASHIILKGGISFVGVK